MKQLPTCAEAKAHAKYLSRSLNINLSYARDAVALRYNCHNWSELSTVFGQLSDKYMSFYGLASHEESVFLASFWHRISQNCKMPFILTAMCRKA